MALFDEGLAQFKAGSYDQALAKIDSALKSLPKDPVLHEVRALCLFALGRYKESAATLNALLASAPGMDWTSMSSLYGSADDYTAQLRKLEARIKSNPTDAPAIFVLAYHYLVIGQNDAAIEALRQVVKLQPKDATAQRMLASLAPPEEKPADPPPPTPDKPAPAGPTTDLVGSWLAKSGNATIQLTIDDQSQFTWRATPQGKPPVELTGTMATTADTIALESKDQGAMVGKVKSGGPDKFTFVMQGMPPSDPGLAFERAK
jgi:tetratricopeptide (TPR) repeat protein